MQAHPRSRPWRTVLAMLIAVSIALPTALMQHGAIAQPNPDKGSGGTGGGSDDDKVYTCHKSSGLVSVTFKPEVELKDLINWAMGFTCKNYIADPRIVTTGKKVTIISPNKVSAADAYEIFLIALSTMGYTLVPKGPVYRIVDAQQAKGETLPIYKKGVPDNTDQIVRYIMRPTYAQAETLRGALDSMRSPAGNVQVVGSLLLITDYASQIRDMMSLAKAIDVPGNNDGIYTINVKYADATQLQTKLNEILGLSGGGAGGAGGAPPPGGKPRVNTPGAPGSPPGTAGEDNAVPSKILVDDRTNTLIVVSSEAGFLRVKSLVERLDISLDTEGGSSIHVYSLDNALAEEIATTLNNVMGQARAQQGGQGGTAPGTNRGPVQQPQPGAENFGASLEGQVRVVGDKPSNSLIVMSSGRDFIAIKKVIKDLDLPRRQVFIEALILEVQLSNETDIGTSSHGGLPVGTSGSLVLGGVQTQNLRSLDLTTLLGATGLVGGLVGSPLANSQTILGKSIPSYGLLFQALANQANTNILSAPHIIAINNEKTEFSVGNNIPYKKGLSFGGLGLPGASGTSGIPGSIGANIDRQKLNLVLNITPHISSDDVVRLDVEHETADIGDKDPELGPTWTERKLKTQVVVHDQQSVVIGGLIQERDIFNTTKVPLLGDIPILGYLFKYTQKTKKKTNLLILLTPYIIKDQLDLQAIRERKTREYQEFTRSFANLDTAKFEPRTDYRRKRGLIEEINRAVQSVEDDMAYQAQFGRRQQVKQGPVEYGPSTIDAPEETTPLLRPTPPIAPEPKKGK